MYAYVLCLMHDISVQRREVEVVVNTDQSKHAVCCRNIYSCGRFWCSLAACLQLIPQQLRLWSIR